VLLDASPEEAVALRDRLCELWPSVLPTLPAPHVASDNAMVRQWAAAEGWDARLAPNHAAVIAVGPPDLQSVDGAMFLAIVATGADEAEATLPANIQTIACVADDAGSDRWLGLAARTGLKRLVSLQDMHHFGPVWDGVEFWRQLFEVVEVS
jgi:hypothetical protein